ncbi:MAG: hypothetical protein Q8R18_00915 [bacterium]|nr:hypothetical protein [bacterium]
METSKIEFLLEKMLADEEFLRKARIGLQSKETKQFLVRHGENGNFTQGELTRVNKYALERMKEKELTPNSAESIRAYSPIYQESLDQTCRTCQYASPEQGIVLFRFKKNYLPEESARTFARLTGMHPSIIREFGYTDEYIILNLLQGRGKNPLLISANSKTIDGNGAHLFILEQKTRNMDPNLLSNFILGNRIRIKYPERTDITKIISYFYQQWTGSIDLLEKRFSIREHEMQEAV